MKPDERLYNELGLPLLDRCPRCDSQLVYLQNVDSGSPQWHVICQTADGGGCNLTGPSSTVKLRAVQMWNDAFWREQASFLPRDAVVHEATEPKASDTPEQWTCGNGNLIDQCLAAFITYGDMQLTMGLLEDLRAIFAECGPAFCRELLPALKHRALIAKEVPF